MKTKFVTMLWLMLILPPCFAQNFQNGLKAYYPCNGNVQDSSGLGHHGTLMNGASFTTNRFGTPNSALLLDGIDDYVELIATAALRPSNFPMTICAWVKPSSSMTSTGVIFANTPLQTQYGGQWLQVNTIIAPQLSASYGIVSGNTGPSSRRTWRSNTTVCDDDWHFVAAVFNNLNDISVMVDCKYPTGYYDGTLSGSFTYPNVLKGVIGRAELVAQSPEYFKGAIDEVRFYDRALTLTELALLCNQATDVTKTTSLSQNIHAFFHQSQNELIIQTQNELPQGDYTLSLTNMLGQVVWQEQSVVMPNTERVYQLPSLAIGCYVLTITNGREVFQQKYLTY